MPTITRDQLTILYMQIRENPVTRQEELDEFVRYSRLKEEQFTVLNLFDTPVFPAEMVDNYHSIFVGGSSDASVLKGHNFLESSKNILLYCLEKEIPVFASCFGFQIAVEALGGKVILDEENLEMGTYQIYRTPEAENDLLFHDVSDGFWAISGHKERALRLPENVIHLAYSDLCPYHAFKVKDKPFYGFQFHPEVNDVDLVNRITRYADRYLEGDDHLKKIIEYMQPTPESNDLVYKFVERVLLS